LHASWTAVAPRIIKHEIGRGPATGAAFHEISRVSVPSLAWRSTRGKSAPMIAYDRSNSATVIEGDPGNLIVLKGQNDLNEELKLFTPGGVTDIDADKVVASQHPERYAVLPQQAGLLQLLETGALSRNGEGDFLIQRKIRLPAELNGGHKLILLAHRRPGARRRARSCLRPGPGNRRAVEGQPLLTMRPLLNWRCLSSVMAGLVPAIPIATCGVCCMSLQVTQLRHWPPNLL
jgi:hypothetical protein